MPRRRKQPVRQHAIAEGGPSRFCIWPYLGLILAILLVHGRIIGHDFVAWDDDEHIIENPYLNPVTPGSVARFWQQPYFSLYVPLSYTFFAVEAWLADLPANASRPSGRSAARAWTT